MALNKIIQKIKNRKRWLIDKKVKSPVTQRSRKSYLSLVPIYVILTLLCWWEYQQNKSLYYTFNGVGIQLESTNAFINQQNEKIKELEENFRNLKKPIVFRPRQTKIEYKTVYVTKYKTAPWQHIPERRGAYIR